ncbi:hypothetical protein EWR38_24050 [Salmonella enterica]|nr:hypothetical protein [Salmonella enterica]
MQFKLNIFTAYLRNHYFLLWMKAAAEIKPQPELKPPAKLTFPDVINGEIAPEPPEDAPPPWEWHGENRFPYEDEEERREEKKKVIAPPPIAPLETGELNKNYFNKFCISRRHYKSRGATAKRKKHRYRLYPPDLNMEGKLPEKPEHYTKKWRVERYFLIAEIAKKIRGEI